MKGMFETVGGTQFEAVLSGVFRYAGGRMRTWKEVNEAAPVGRPRQQDHGRSRSLWGGQNRDRPPRQMPTAIARSADCVIRRLNCHLVATCQSLTSTMPASRTVGLSCSSLKPSG
jgi:hypothetical protein